MGRRKGRRRGREYYDQSRRRNLYEYDPQREIFKNIPSLEELLGITPLRYTIAKGFRDSAQKIGRRTDPLENKRLYERSLRKQKQRRDDMLRKVAAAERVARSKRPKEDRYKPTGIVVDKIDRICSDRSKRRETLFAKKMIGKGKGSGKTRRYTEDSKVKC